MQPFIETSLVVVTTAMMQQHTLLQASSRSSAASYLNTRPSGSTLNAVSRNVLVTRAQQQPRPQQSSSRFTSAEKNWRWFGFHATACPSTPPTECISLAVYDLESGDFYSTLINPKLHNSDFRFTPTSLKGGWFLLQCSTAGAESARGSNSSSEEESPSQGTALLC